MKALLTALLLTTSAAQADALSDIVDDYERAQRMREAQAELDNIEWQRRQDAWKIDQTYRKVTRMRQQMETQRYQEKMRQYQ